MVRVLHFVTALNRITELQKLKVADLHNICKEASEIYYGWLELVDYEDSYPVTFERFDNEIDCLNDLTAVPMLTAEMVAEKLKTLNDLIDTAFAGL